MMRTVIVALLSLLGFSAAHATTLLHDNGGFVTGTGNGFNGANTSTWQNVTWTTGGGTATIVGLGFNSSFFRIVEDFTVPTGFLWTLDSLSVYGFRTTSTSQQQDPPVSPFTSLSFVVYDSFAAMQARTPFAGSWSQNTLRETSWTGAYRVAESQPTNRQRAIMSITGAANQVPILTAGRYWIEFGVQTANPNDSPGAIPVMPHTTAGNAWQRDALTGQLYNLDPLEMPFQLRGVAQPVPEPATWITLTLACALVRRRARRP